MFELKKSEGPKWILIGTGLLGLIAAFLVIVVRYHEIRKASAEAERASIEVARASIEAERASIDAELARTSRADARKPSPAPQPRIPTVMPSAQLPMPIVPPQPQPVLPKQTESSRPPDEPTRSGKIDLLKDATLSAWNLFGETSKHWSLENGILRFDGVGKEEHNILTKRQFRNFTLQCEWKIGSSGDSGLYLRGRPQVQIWDHTRGMGTGIGSGGLYNNATYQRHPTAVADNAIGRWNAMTVTMRGDRVTVELNGKTVTKDIRMENWPDRKRDLPAAGPIGLQAFGSPIEFRNIFVEELGD